MCVHVGGFSVSLRCTLARFCSVHTGARSAHLPVQIHLPPTFCSLDSPRDVCPGHCQRRAVWCVLQLLAGSLLPCKEGHFPTGSDVGQGQAARPGPRLRGAESTDFGALGAALWVLEPVMGEGGVERCVRRVRVCARGLGHVSVSSEGQGCQGAAAQPALVSSSGGSAAEAPGSSRTERLPCLLPSPQGDEPSFRMALQALPRGQHVEAGLRRWPFTRRWNNLFLFTDRYIYIIYPWERCRDALMPSSRMVPIHLPVLSSVESQGSQPMIFLSTWRT